MHTYLIHFVVISLFSSCPIHNTYPKQNPYFRSQFGQDAYVNILLTSQKIENGVYLDIGCNDGIDGSNTYFFHKKGWYGKCLEADPKTYKRIFRNSRREDGINLAVSNTSLGTYFNRVSDPNNGLSGIVSSMSQHKHALWHRFSVQRIHVKTITPTQILKRFYQRRTIDFVSLDVEGGELDIIKIWPFNRNCVRIFSIEDNNWCNAMSSLEKLKTYLQPNGYKLEKLIGMDYIFMKHCV